MGRSWIGAVLAISSLCGVFADGAFAHPASRLVVNGKGEVFFVYTGQGVCIPAPVAPDENKLGPRTDSFLGSRAGDAREVAGIKLCWCPAGRFVMGSPRNEPERRPGE